MTSLGVLTANRPFRALWLARSTSYVGDFITLTAVTLLVYGREHSSESLGIVLAAQALPQALGPLAGAIADRADARRVMIGCDLLRVATIGSIAVVLPPFPVLVGLIAASSVLTTLFLPAGKSSVPRLVERSLLGRANASLGFSHNVAVAVGPVIGAFSYQALGPRPTFALDAASFVASALLLAGLPRRQPARRSSSRLTLLGADALEGFRYAMRHPVARAVALGLFASVSFAALDNVALVFRIRGELGGAPSALGLASGAYGVAMMVAPALFVALLRSLPGLRLLMIGLACAGAGLLLTGVVGILPAAIVVYALAGVGNGFENIGVDTAIGEHVDEAMLGRVFGAVYGPIFVAEAIAALLGGRLVAATSAHAVFIISGLGVLAACPMVWLIIRRRPAPSAPPGSVQGPAAPG